MESDFLSKQESIKILPTDYTDYGGNIVRWENNQDSYPDCSCGCVYWNRINGDWGICENSDGPRYKLLTFEHQAGYNCFSRE